MQYFNRSSSVLVCLIIVVFILSCTSRRMVLISDNELKDGETVFSVICLDGDSISFSGYRFGTSYSRLQGKYVTMLEGEGAVFTQESIVGVLADGSERAISVDSVHAVEVNRFNTGKTLLYIGPIAAISIYVFVKIGESMRIGPFFSGGGTW